MTNGAQEEKNAPTYKLLNLNYVPNLDKWGYS